MFCEEYLYFVNNDDIVVYNPTVQLSNNIVYQDKVSSIIVTIVLLAFFHYPQAYLGMTVHRICVRTPQIGKTFMCIKQQTS